MKIIGIIYLCTSISYLLLILITSLVCKSRFKKEYPDRIIPKEPIIESIATYIRMILIAICPIINFIMVLIFIFGYEKIIEECMYDIEEKSIEKGKEL